MNKVEYLKELDRLLKTIPESERVEALTYYEEYFDDAGVENEQTVIEELGYPAKIAENIKEGIRGNMDFKEIYDRTNPNMGTGFQNAEKGYQNNGTGYQNTGFQHVGTQNIYTSQPQQSRQQQSQNESGKLPSWAIVLIVIGCLMASPVILGGAAGVIGSLFGAIMAIIGGIIGVGAAGIGLLMGAVACFVVGFACVFTTPFAGMVLIGTGLLLTAISLLFIMLTVWLCGWALPTFIKWIAGLFRKLFNKNKEQNV